MIYLDEDTAQQTCDRCGFVWQFPRRYLDRDYNTDLCWQCRGGRAPNSAKTISECLPWKGDVDLDTMQPLDDQGKPYRPGHRTCGHADCVRLAHILDENGVSMRQERRTGCVHVGCDRKHFAKGVCKMHYARLMRIAARSGSVVVG